MADRSNGWQRAWPLCCRLGARAWGVDVEWLWREASVRLPVPAYVSQDQLGDEGRAVHNFWAPGESIVGRLFEVRPAAAEFALGALLSVPVRNRLGAQRARSGWGGLYGGNPAPFIETRSGA